MLSNDFVKMAKINSQQGQPTSPNRQKKFPQNKNKTKKWPIRKNFAPHGGMKCILQGERPLVSLSEKKKGRSCLNQVKPVNLELLFQQLLDEAEIDTEDE